MAISDQGERVDAYQVLDGTRPEVVVMMAVDSGSEVHTAPVTFPWNVEQFDKTSICLSDVQGNTFKVYGTALLNYGVHDVSGNVIEIGTRFLVSDTEICPFRRRAGAPWLEYNSGNHAVSVTRSWMSSSFDAQGEHFLFVSSFGTLH